MTKVRFNNNEFDTEHEAICSALFKRYGWRWERPKHSLDGWLPDLLLRGDTHVWVECKGGLEWSEVSTFPDLRRYEDAVSGTEQEVLLIPESPQIITKPNGYAVNVLGFLYDGDLWSYAELGRWSGKVGFCHSANSWKDRMSGEHVKNASFGDGPPPNIEVDWRSATQIVRGKPKSYFKGFVDSEVEEWGPPQ